MTMQPQPYDPSKYLPDPTHPELVCPVEDYECSSVKDFELHLLTYHDAEELIPYLIRLQDYNWEMEKLIRKLTGKQSYEVILSQVSQVSQDSQR